ncbi:MAG: heavy metal translocating P-type ATPase [Phycisphaerales bacterium]
MATETFQPVAAPSVVPACTHCGLSVPKGLVRDGETEQFCCHGCRAAYAVIGQCGLGDYYKLLERTDEHGSRATADDGAFAEFDDPAFEALYVRPADPRTSSGGLKRLDLVLENIHCAACVWLLERLPRIVPGVSSATLMLGRSTVSVVYSSDATTPSRIAAAIAALGYTPHAPRGQSARDAQLADERRQFVRIAVAGACAGNVMLFAFALYGGLFGGAMPPAVELAFRWMSLGAGLLSMAWPGRQFFRSAWASIRTGTPSIDAPIVLALLAGGVMGLINTLLNRGEIYFDSLTMLVFLLLVGRYFGARQQRRAADSVELLFSLTSGRAWRVDEAGQPRRVPIESIRAGDLVEVRPGESIPVDGVIEQGATSIDQAMLTGESRPVSARSGAEVLAGTVNLTGVIRVRARRTGSDTRAGRLMELVTRCAANRPAIVRFADSIAKPFTVAALCVAAITFAAWWFIDPARALDHAVSLLIVTCPCALGIAAPLAVHAAIGQGARRGMLVKDGDVLERLARTGLILLDKTGTLTEGRMRVITAVGDEEAIKLAAAVESAATHPIASAIRDEFHDGTEPDNVEQTGRGGIRGSVRGQSVTVGNEVFASANSVGELPLALRAAIDSARTSALTPLVVGVNGLPKAVIVVGDRLREDAAHSIDELKRDGWRVGILSGDEPAIVASLARTLGLDARDCYGGVHPEEKASLVRERMQHGPVVMVGDGVNDAAALASASVGIAVHGGAEASMAAADAYLARPGLTPVVELVRGGPRMVRVVKRIFAASLGYNLFAGTLAAAGLIHPVIAAILMPVSSLTVITIALRSRTFRTPAPETEIR